jgi:hypothetical protein
MKYGVKKTAGDPLKIRLLVHAGSNTRGAPLSLSQKDALLSMIRGIAREPRIGSFSVVAFNVDQSQVIFRQESVRQIDFTALDRAIGSWQSDTVAVNQLAATYAGTRFFVELAGEEAMPSCADALIFVGPRLDDATGLTVEMLRRLGTPRCPVFYLRYNPAWKSDRGQDLIRSAVKHWQGYLFHIRKPVDLLAAWPKIMSRISNADASGNASMSP